jgi:hypothetical protein
MAREKKPYSKPKLKAQKMSMGVYGDYTATGEATEPFDPVTGKKPIGDEDRNI